MNNTLASIRTEDSTPEVLQAKPLSAVLAKSLSSERTLAVQAALAERPVKRWPPEHKAQARRRNLQRRILKSAPLFADELIARELARRPEYFNGH